MSLFKRSQWDCLDLELLEYSRALKLQQDLVEARFNRSFENDVVILTEHPCVFTLGRRGGLENFKVNEAFLKKSKIPVINAERGGNITFHGPGQLVVYPVVGFNKAGMDIASYVTNLEKVMILTAADFGIAAESNPAGRGIWVGSNKLGSIGIAVRQGVCFHGFALNVNLSLEPFDWIYPCGLKGIGITSMSRELSQTVAMRQVRKSVKYHLEDVFETLLVNKSLSEIQALLEISGQNCRC